jgi:hypothetical protein
MLSESARNNSAAQSRFRIQAPNASPRTILVVALDGDSAAEGARLAEAPWRGTRFVGFEGLGRPRDAKTLDAALEGCDLLVMVGKAGRDLSPAEEIGSKCAAAGVKVSGVILASGTETNGQVAAGLGAMRGWTRTLALVVEPDDLAGLLHALGA